MKVIEDFLATVLIESSMTEEQLNKMLADYAEKLWIESQQLSNERTKFEFVFRSVFIFTNELLKIIKEEVEQNIKPINETKH